MEAPASRIINIIVKEENYFHANGEGSIPFAKSEKVGKSLECSFRCECTNSKKKKRKKKGLVRGAMEALRTKFSSPPAAKNVNECLFSKRVDLHIYAYEDENILGKKTPDGSRNFEIRNLHDIRFSFNTKMV